MAEKIKKRHHSTFELFIGNIPLIHVERIPEFHYTYWHTDLDIDKIYPLMMDISRGLSMISDNPKITLEFDSGADLIYKYPDFINEYWRKDITSRIISRKVLAIKAAFPICENTISIAYASENDLFGFNSEYNLSEMEAGYFAKTNPSGRIMGDSEEITDFLDSAYKGLKRFDSEFGDK